MTDPLLAEGDILQWILVKLPIYHYVWLQSAGARKKTIVVVLYDQVFL